MVWEIVINLLPTTSRAVDHQTYLTGTPGRAGSFAGSKTTDRGINTRQNVAVYLKHATFNEFYIRSCTQASNSH